MTTHCGSAIDNIPPPPFWFSEFRPNNFIPHKDHQHYSQKIRGACSLDTIDDLNPAVVSICPYGHWLSLRHWKHSPTFWFSEPYIEIPHRSSWPWLAAGLVVWFHKNANNPPNINSNVKPLTQQHLAHWITYRQMSLDLSHAWGDGGGGSGKRGFLLWLTVQPGDFKPINVRGGIDRLLSVYPCQFTPLCEILNAIDGYHASNPGFPLVSLLKLPSGLMDRP